MTTTLEALARDVQYLSDRQAILDCIANQSRGHDRHDVDLMTSVYHGRYVDRLDKRDGVWRIAVRRCTLEVAFTVDTSMLTSDALASFHFAKGSRDPRDLTYQRPLEIDTPAPEVW
jgi:hypothetical protein